MASSPPANFAIEALKAAGPDAAERLSSTLKLMAPNAAKAASTGFEATLKSQGADAQGGTDAAVLPLGQSLQVVKHESRTVSPYQKFEGFVLRTFIEDMLPSSETSSFFGTGTAGNIWRSMLAEQMGDELARSGGIGIADMLEKSRAELPGTKGHDAATSGAADARKALAAGEADAAALTSRVKL
ncbi:rod-binding protein [Aurantimonas sp. MSK8Z-1]|uniref:rod-binding protein n=1 Tax=Mangrovibrevibacter kandeliae TaxID=2968473 RepID=UPI002118A754|nr:rod-binding protein [Aurantimonas sp. MSK8Z-1]MCW4113723.1 rod-binding protein [Aurantimonas sp. MSK8Z-1]